MESKIISLARILVLFTVLFPGGSVRGQSAAEWNALKQRYGLPSSLTYNQWVAQGCPTGGSGAGGGGYSPPPNYGPTPEQLAAQQAALALQRAEQLRRERLKAAFNRNEMGISYCNKKDWVNAVAYFQQAHENSPGDNTISANLSKAQEQLNELRLQEERQRADRSTADDMKAAIGQITNSMRATGPNMNTPPAHQVPSGGLDFIPSSGDQDQPITTGAFGSKQSNAKLEPLQFGDQKAADQKLTSKAVDQLTSIAHTEKSITSRSGQPSITAEGADTKLGLGFDTSVKKSGSLSSVNVETPSAAMEMPVITPAMAKDPIVQQDLKNYNEWKPQLDEARKAVAQAEADMSKAQDPGAKAMATVIFNQAKSKSDGLAIAVESVKKDIEDRKIHLNKFEVSTAVPESNALPGPTPSN